MSGFDITRWWLETKEWADIFAELSARSPGRQVSKSEVFLEQKKRMLARGATPMPCRMLEDPSDGPPLITCPLCNGDRWCTSKFFPKGQRVWCCFSKDGKCGYWIADSTPLRSGVNPFQNRMHSNCMPGIRYPYDVNVSSNDNWIPWGQELR